MTPAEVNTAMAVVHEVLGAPLWVKALSGSGIEVRLERGWGHMEPGFTPGRPFLVHCSMYCGLPDTPHGLHYAWAVRSGWQPAPKAAPADPAQHWLTRFDPADGEPYGELCSCPHGEDHTVADLKS
jgi:hypothetical protein